MIQTTPLSTRKKATSSADLLRAALQRATGGLEASEADYQSQVLAGGGIKEALARAIAEANPQVSQVRRERNLAQERLGTVFANSLDELKGEADPFAREKIRALRSAQFTREAQDSGGRLQDLQADQAGQVDRFGNVFGALTSAKQFDVERKREALQRAAGNVQRVEDREFESRFDDLTRREKEASIAAANRSNRGDGPGLTFLQGLDNPLAQFIKGGGKRIAKPDGGFDFVAPDGRKITVEEAAAMTSAGTPAELLIGSRHAQDVKVISDSSGNPPSAEAAKIITSAQSGLRSLDTIKQLLPKDPKGNIRFFAKLPFGGLRPDAQTYQNASRNISDVLARLRTGAQINREEEALYKKFVPGPLDTSESSAQKIATLEFIFKNLASGKRPSSTELQNVTAVDTGV